SAVLLAALPSRLLGVSPKAATPLGARRRRAGTPRKARFAARDPALATWPAAAMAARFGWRGSPNSSRRRTAANGRHRRRWQRRAGGTPGLGSWLTRALPGALWRFARAITLWPCGLPEPPARSDQLSGRHPPSIHRFPSGTDRTADPAHGGRQASEHPVYLLVHGRSRSGYEAPPDAHSVGVSCLCSLNAGVRYQADPLGLELQYVLTSWSTGILPRALA
ncbi:MAG: hypothetical protein K0Q60_2796, partial [Microvirga sp.]|nr:hypothetical protein [Microvirga sp.]